MTKTYPIYKTVKYWLENYAPSISDDRRAMQEFMECETDELIRSLRTELYSMSQGNYDNDILTKLIGRGRLAKYSTYDEWAKLALLWISENKN